MRLIYQPPRATKPCRRGKALTAGLRASHGARYIYTRRKSFRGGGSRESLRMYGVLLEWCCAMRTGHSSFAQLVSETTTWKPARVARLKLYDVERSTGHYALCMFEKHRWVGPPEALVCMRVVPTVVESRQSCAGVGRRLGAEPLITPHVDHSLFCATDRTSTAWFPQ